MGAIVERLFLVSQGSQPMVEQQQARAVAGCGLEGDRYCQRTGYWTDVDECQVTLIEAEALQTIQEDIGIQVNEGQHRRNLVTRGVRLETLRGQRFRIGDAVLEYDRPRPPCAYIESITQPGMLRALLGRGGICARVIVSGVIKTGDEIVVL